jgi:hypothetical protein
VKIKKVHKSISLVENACKKVFILYGEYTIIMSSESEEDNDQPRPPKTRGEVYSQEQERIVEEARAGQSKDPRPPKTRGEVYAQEQERIVEERRE